MMRLSTALLEGKKLPRVILSVRPSDTDPDRILTLMRRAYEMDAWCFDLPTPSHHRALKELKGLVGEDSLIGLPHFSAEEGASLSGNPLRRFEKKVAATITKNIFSPDLVRRLKKRGAWRSPYFYTATGSREVLTSKEIGLIRFDASRFERVLSPFQPRISPFLFIGERYGDWFLALGRADLLKAMVSSIREKGFIPILSGQWATFFLPKAKSLDAAAYAVPINREMSFFDFDQACGLIKKFDKPLVSLNALAGREVVEESEEAFSFLFNELKISFAVAEADSEEGIERVLRAAWKVPSLTIHRKRGSPPSPGESSDYH